MKRRILSALVLLGVFCARTQLQSDIASVSVWHGWYARDHKIGYFQTITQTYPDHYRIESRGKLVTQMMGTPTVATVNTVYNTDKTYALRDFDFTMTTAGHPYHLMGVARGHAINMTVESGDQRQSSSLAVAGPVYPYEALPFMVAGKKDLQPNQKYVLSVFRADAQTTCDAEVTFLGREQLTLRDTIYEALKFSTNVFNMTSTTWIDTLGNVLREESPPSSVSVLEPPEMAMATKLEDAPQDLMQMFAVPLEEKLDNATARSLKYAKLELTGIDPKGFDLSDETQKIVNEAPLTLAITPVSPPSSPVRLPVTGDTSGLKPTLLLQSDNPLIIRKAKEIAGSNTDAVKVARDIADWVFHNVQPKGSASMPSALDVLKTMEGDCNEHAVLYAALCRAIGIPCTVCVGLIFQDGFFWYHAWNKVYLGGWVPVDATWGQFPVDATHLKLKEGDLAQQAQVLAVVGKLGIKLLESR